MILHKYRCSVCGAEYMVPRKDDPSHCDDAQAIRVYSPPNISAAALPNKGAPVIAAERKQKRWDRDGDAYRRLRREGLQPPQVDNAAKLETLAERREHVEMGASARLRDPDTGEKRWVKDSAFTAFTDTFGKSALEA